jgi:branched-chain amino acid transport system ATP-binding protein
MKMLSVENLIKNFGGLAALFDVCFEVEKGSITGIIGPNGAGKTTLFNLISGSLPPSGGRIVFRDRDITQMRSDQICRMGISRTYQRATPFGTLSVLHNVLVGVYFGRDQKYDGRRARSEAMGTIRFLELDSYVDVSAEKLSPLNKKRLELARALATNPELLLLDEIAAGLTPSETLQMMEIIRQIQSQGITILMIEHIMKAVMDLSDLVIVLHHGMKIAEGEPKEVSSNPKVIEAYLGQKRDEG